MTMTTFRVALLLLLLVDVVVRAQPSRRAQCAIECYSKCMLAGTPNAVYCNCPVAKSARVCVGATEEFLQRKLSAEDLSATTEYLSAHSIRIATTSLPKTFMNIFEYTEIENLNKSNVKWTFAGASSGHDLTFSVNDPCREYAYRVISILKTSDAENHLTVYRSQTISTTLPSFSVNPELIKLDEPEYSQREEMITVTAIWMNPGGYLDTDIAGVEAPEAYPIQCQSPEGALPEPKVELFYNGGRISVDLPSDVLAERCRYLFQVKVLPKCGRLEPFTVQTHIEVNCENFPSHPICSRERAPQCTNIVDVWGSSKNATVMWKLRDQDDKPLYYHVRHGPVESKGAVPFVSWKIVKGKEEKVRPEVNSLEVEVKPDQDYGVQVCAVYSKLYRSPKFDLVSVTPFVCTPCSVSDTVTGEWFQKCEECSKIEGEVVAKGGATSIKVISMEAPLLSVDAKKPSTKLTPVVETKTTVPSSTVVMTTETTTTEAETMPPTSIDLEETSNDLSVSEALLFPPIASRATEEATKTTSPATSTRPPTSSPAPSPSTTTPREIRKHQKSTTRVPVAEDCANPPPNCRCETDPRCCFLSTNDDDCVRRTNKSPPSTPTFCLAKEELAVTYELDSRTARVRATSLPERISEAAADSVWIGWRPHVPGPRVTASDVIDASEVTRRGVFTQKLYNLKMPKGVSEMSHEIRICVVNSTDIDSNRVVFALNDKSLKLQTKKEFEERPADSAALSQALLFYGPLSAIFLLVIFILGIIYLNCSRIRRFYERKRIYNLHPGTLRAAYRPYNTQYRGPFYHYGNTRVYQA